jgi:hypothetical protein
MPMLLIHPIAVLLVCGAAKAPKRSNLIASDDQVKEGKRELSAAGYASRMRAIAAVWRPHCSFSAVSALRPFAVSK